jgi:RNA polymerase sigma-70 factor (ECF subfamily)
MIDMSSYDEAALIEAVKQGDTDAFIHLYNRYHAGLYTYIVRFIKIPELAEDVLQEVFIKLWTVRERVKPELSLQAYLYRISRNKVFKLLKKISSDQELKLKVITEIDLSLNDTDNKARWNQYQQMLQSAINALPPQRQKVFRLCREQGKTYKEVAIQLNISPNTVKEHMILATKSVWEHFSRHGETFFYSIPLLYSLTGIL